MDDHRARELLADDRAHHRSGEPPRRDRLERGNIQLRVQDVALRRREHALLRGREHAVDSEDDLEGTQPSGRFFQGGLDDLHDGSVLILAAGAQNFHGI